MQSHFNLIWSSVLRLLFVIFCLLQAVTMERSVCYFVVVSAILHLAAYFICCIVRFAPYFICCIVRFMNTSFVFITSCLYDFLLIPFCFKWTPILSAILSCYFYHAGSFAIESLLLTAVWSVLLERYFCYVVLELRFCAMIPGNSCRLYTLMCCVLCCVVWSR